MNTSPAGKTSLLICLKGIDNCTKALDQCKGAVTQFAKKQFSAMAKEKNCRKYILLTQMFYQRFHLNGNTEEATWPSGYGSVSDAQRSGPRFEPCSGHLLDLFSVIPSSNPSHPFKSQLVPTCQLGFFSPVVLYLNILSLIL